MTSSAVTGMTIVEDGCAAVFRLSIFSINVLAADTKDLSALCNLNNLTFFQVLEVRLLVDVVFLRVRDLELLCPALTSRRGSCREYQQLRAGGMRDDFVLHAVFRRLRASALRRGLTGSSTPTSRDTTSRTFACIAATAFLSPDRYFNRLCWNNPSNDA